MWDTVQASACGGRSSPSSQHPRARATMSTPRRERSSDQTPFNPWPTYSDNTRSFGPTISLLITLLWGCKTFDALSSSRLRPSRSTVQTR
ncbi:hypothetical protein GY45DRAFT_1033765 [Cubamyces sp. BRFM 1775]|nr:hypothetical protein GY45DRAFT_1033765 [Cubamyces sp. BRFM 1775]